MRFFALLSALVVFAFCAPVHAEDTPPPVPAPVGQTALTTPASAPAAPQPPAPAPAATQPAVARKEETEVKIRSGFFSGLFPDKNSLTKGQAVDEITKLRSENETLRTQLAAAQRELSDAKAELKAISDDWPAIRDALMAGKADAPVLQTPLGKEVTQATAAAAAATTAQTNHPATQLPGPGAAPAANNPAAPAKQPTAADLIKLGMQQHREKQRQN